MNSDRIITKLKNLTELDVQNNWYFTDENLTNPPLEISSQWQKAVVNENKYLVWEKGDRVRWFAQKITIPVSLNKDNYPLKDLSLRIKLTWWAQSAQIFVNGKLVNEGDLFDSSCRVLLTQKVVANQEFLVALRLVSPSHDIGGLMFSQCLYESEYDKLDPSFVANEIAIIDKYITNFHPEEKSFFDEYLQQIDWQVISNRLLFNQQLNQFRQTILPLAKYIKQRSFNLLGHAHLDMAWLWTIEETYDVAERTFNSVLNLQKDNENLVFGHTTAYLYQWIEEHNPDLFNKIKDAISKGKWEVLGGMWVEPEVNLISGESLVRQLLYGQKYSLEKFGKYDRVAWLPDTFGFPWQLPQILRQANIEYFVTGKLHWNDTNKFPHGCFWWQSPDGSQIFTAMSPPNVAGVMDTHPLVMTDYSVEWENQTGLQDSFWLPGVGDHGGGPTRDMLDVAKRYQDSPFFPQLNFSTASQYLDKISHTSNHDDFPVWDNELYLELHRGCYTTHADQKYYNRYAERLLYQAELFATIDYILAQKYQADFKANNETQQQIKHIWQKVLLNQFHDILPGTSIPPVFTASNQLWGEVIEEGETILNNSLHSIASYIDVPTLPDLSAQVIVVFNSLNWKRSQIVELEVNPTQYTIYDSQHSQLITQVSHDEKLLFLAEDIPSVGYKLFYLVSTNSPKNIDEINQETSISESSFMMKNDNLKIIIDCQTGNLTNVYDIVNQKEIVKGQANELQLFQDSGQYWDAWNIDPNYEQHLLDTPEVKSIKWLEKGKLRQIIRVEKIFNKSSFIQDYILETNSPIIKIKNQVNWQEDYTLLKVNFPCKIESDYVTYEIACGSIKRTTKPVTATEKAQWEVYGHQWADLGNDDYGVSLITDSKYGYDSKPNQLRLSLLRSPKWPDSQCDRGQHNFTYALYPHQNSWQKAQTVRQGYQLNTPLQTIFLSSLNNQLTNLSSTETFIDFGSDNLILISFKQAEDCSNKFILRGYESHHQPALFTSTKMLDLSILKPVNLLEDSLDNHDRDFKTIKPSSIFTFLLS